MYLLRKPIYCKTHYGFFEKFILYEKIVFRLTSLAKK